MVVPGSRNLAKDLRKQAQHGTEYKFRLARIVRDTEPAGWSGKIAGLTPATTVELFGLATGHLILLNASGTRI